MEGWRREGKPVVALLIKRCRPARPLDLKVETVLGGWHLKFPIPEAEGVSGGLQMIQSWGMGEPKR